MGLAEFCALTSATAFDVAARGLLLADILGNGARVNEPPARVPYGWEFGVCGVGVEADDKRLYTTVFTTKGLSPGKTDALKGYSGLADALAKSLGSRPSWFDDVRLVGVNPPEPQVAVGDAISATFPGAAGCNVRWSGTAGFLTVGHVAGAAPCLVSCAGKPIGTVAYSNDPTNHGTTPEADVALITLNQGATLQNPFTGSVTIGANTSVSVVKSSGRVAATVRSFSTFQYSPKLQGTWGDTYITTAVVTKGGDSGAPVVNSVNAVIGHVVGAIPGYGTLIQAIDYQLRAISLQQQFSGIQI
jgi:hypothetical protein